MAPLDDHGSVVLVLGGLDKPQRAGQCLLSSIWSAVSTRKVPNWTSGFQLSSNSILHSYIKPYRVRIELRHNQVAVVIHAFTEQEAKDCFESLKQHISSLKITKYSKVTLLQLKFLQLNKPGLMKDHNV